MTQRGFQLYCLAFSITAIGTFSVLVLNLCDGKLIYTLDDPYIHLAVAENILHGGYGVNAEEFSSPSSSILFPLLLTLPIALGLGDWGPFIFSSAAVLLSLWLLGGFLWRQALSPLLPERSALACLLAALLAPALFFGLNLAPAIFSGLEQPLHILLTLATLIGLAESLERERPPLWLFFAIFFLPLVRFEGMALATSALAALFLMGQRRKALFSFISILGALTIYALTMRSLGLPILPSSVLVKSEVANTTLGADLLNTLRTLRNNVFEAFKNRWGLTYLAALGCLALFFLLQFRRYGFRTWLVFAAGALALGAHVALVAFPGAPAWSRYLWFWRYEVYAEAAVVVLLFLAAGMLVLRSSAWRAMLVVPLLFLSFMAVDNWRVAAKIPTSAQNIYSQQFQMHLFATEHFPQAVAVNDLGWTGYRNDAYVLDLWGLGSEEARKLRQGPDAKPEAIAVLAQRKKVHYAMVYDLWLGKLIPDDWCRMALLITPKVTAASPFVSFYLIERAEEPTFLAALSQFKARLPKGSTLIVGSCDKPVGD